MYKMKAILNPTTVKKKYVRNQQEKKERVMKRYPDFLSPFPLGILYNRSGVNVSPIPVDLRKFYNLDKSKCLDILT